MAGDRAGDLLRRRAGLRRAGPVPIPERRWNLWRSVSSLFEDPFSPVYLVLGLIAFTLGVESASSSLDPNTRLSLPALVALTSVPAILALFVWHVLPVRATPKPFVLRVVRESMGPAVWPISIVVVAVLTTFVQSSLDGESARADLASSLDWAVLVGIVVAMSYAAVRTIDLATPTDRHSRDFARRRVENLFPVGQGSLVGRGLEYGVRGVAIAVVGVATTWLGIIGVWSAVGSVLWVAWVSFDFHF
jgi:hypothetical protein